MNFSCYAQDTNKNVAKIALRTLYIIWALICSPRKNMVR